MKITIVTISFNQAEFLEEAISSVLSQDQVDLQYVVVDPGSTDGSLAIIENCKNRIAQVMIGPDEGPADGLNKGFSAADGDIYGFLNSDDVIEPRALSEVAAFFNANPEIDVVSGHSTIIDGSGQPLRRFYSDRYSLRMAAYGASILAQPSTFFRASAFRAAGGFNVDNRSNWDAELFIDMKLAGARFMTVPRFWSRYRVHEQGITGSGKLHELHLAHRQRMFRKIMRREPGLLDTPIGWIARQVRKLANPGDTIERLRRGPVYRSAK